MVTPVATPQQTDAREQLNKLLDTYGLGSLKDWAWEQIVQNRTPDEIVAYLYERPEFKARFPAIAERRAAGLAPITPEQYILYEESARQAMRAANLPKGFWDKPSDFHALIAADVSVDELNARITRGYQLVAQAPPAVRNAYAGYFGVAGDAALASQFLDPNRSQAVLEHNVRAATFGGIGTEHGWKVNLSTAGGFADRDITTPEIEAGYGRADALRPLAEETVTETQDLNTNDVFGAAFGTTDDDNVFKRRLDARKAANEGKGEAASSDRGVIGLGQSWP